MKQLIGYEGEVLECANFSGLVWIEASPQMLEQEIQIYVK